MKALIIAGLARSGKDTVADYLAGKYGFSKFVMSDALIEGMKKKGIATGKMNISKFGDELRKKKGMAAVAELVYGKIEIEKPEKAVIVGPRSVEEIDFFKRKFQGIKIILVDAPKEKRFERRSEKDPQEKNEFFERDERDSRNKGLRKVLAMADFNMRNESSVEELHKKVDSLVKGLAI